MKIINIEWDADDDIKKTLPETMEFENGDDLSKKEILFLLERKFGYSVNTFARDESGWHLSPEELSALFGPPSIPKYEGDPNES